MYSHQIRKQFSFKEFTLVFLSLITFLVAGILHQNTSYPKLVLDKQDSAINVDKAFIKYAVIGNKRLFTDLLWIQTLLESDTEHYKNNDLNNWMFLRFDAIAELDSQFYENYRYGGQYLAIVKDDLLGANVILEKGIQYYPHDYNLRYSLGINYYFELGDYKKGLQHLELIQYHPRAPDFFKSIVSKMKFELTFNFDYAIATITDLYTKEKDSLIKSKLENELYSLHTERDLRCLSDSKSNCKKTDYYGNPYIIINNEYNSQISFKPYRLSKKRAPSKGAQNLNVTNLTQLEINNQF